MFKRLLKSRLVINSVIVFTGGMIVSLGNYIFQLIMARLLSIEHFGELGALNSSLYILGVPSVTIATVIMKYTAEFKAKGELPKVLGLFYGTTKRLLVVGVLGFVIFALLSPFIANFLKIPGVLPVIIIGTTIIVALLSSINLGILQGLQQFFNFSLGNIISTVAKIVLGLLFVGIGLQVSGAVGAIALSGLVTYLLSLYFIKPIFKNKPDYNFRHDIFLKYSFPVFLTLLATILLFNLDVILIKHFLSAETAGMYNALSLLGKIVFMVCGMIAGTVMFPMISEAYAKEKPHQHLLRNSVLIVSFLSLGVVAAYFLFPSLVIKILLGSKYISLAPFIGWFGVAMFLYALIDLFTKYFLCIHKNNFIYIILFFVFLQGLFLSLFHDNLWQVVVVMNGVMATTLAALLVYYFKVTRGKKIQNARNKKQTNSNIQ